MMLHQRQGAPRAQFGVALCWSCWGPAAPGAPGAQLGQCPKSTATELPVPLGTRGHRDPILAPGSVLGLAGGEVLGWGALPGCGQGKDKDRDTNQPGRAGPDKQGCILHTYINTVQGEETFVGRGSAALQRVPRWSCLWDPLWTLLRPPQEGGGVVPREGEVGGHPSHQQLGQRRAWGAAWVGSEASCPTLAGCPHPAPWHLCPSQHLDVPDLRGSLLSHVPNDGVVPVVASAACRARGRFGQGKPHS